MKRRAFALVCVFLGVALAQAVKNQGYLPFADAPINYRSAQVDDPVARLNQRLERGSTKLRWEQKNGYLRSVLQELRIPESSQTLVFSKTSFQFPMITPAQPRALYYNDDVYVGQVQNGKFLEFVSFDARQGAIFYVLDEQQSEMPRFERAATDCVQCHVADATKGVPGVMLRSVFARASGYPAGGAHSFVTGQESPWHERWGGWYLTGPPDANQTMANVLVAPGGKPELLDSLNLATALDPRPYLTGSSDSIALTVLAHQTQMHNLITLVNYQTRLGGGGSYQESAEKLLRYLLFTNEASMVAEVRGDSSFSKDFVARGPFDSQRRSLREFDLRTRTFRYPCSYLIYSETFDAIPNPAKQYIYRRLLEVLSGRDSSADFRNLSAGDRQAILEILYETKPGLPAEWKQLVEETKQTTMRQTALRQTIH